MWTFLEDLLRATSHCQRDRVFLPVRVIGGFHSHNQSQPPACQGASTQSIIQQKTWLAGHRIATSKKMCWWGDLSLNVHKKILRLLVCTDLHLIYTVFFVTRKSVIDDSDGREYDNMGTGSELITLQSHEYEVWIDMGFHSVSMRVFFHSLRNRGVFEVQSTSGSLS